MYIKARVTAGAKKETFEQVSKDHVVISVKEPAEQNRANKRVIEIIALHLGVPTGKVRLISGHHSPSKIMDVLLPGE